MNQKANEFITFPFDKKSSEEMKKKSEDFYKLVNQRRTIRDFSEESFPIEVIQNCIKAANTAPSGANHQPWTFVVIQNAGIKKEIRIAAEKEEAEFYGGRAPKDWLDDLKKFGTDANKPFLENAPYLIAIFERKFEIGASGEKIKNYYVKESVGLAAGLLITALHIAGVATLTHTPSPMNFLNKILERPENEKPFLLLVTGFPSDGCKVPVIKRKDLEEVMLLK